MSGRGTRWGVMFCDGSVMAQWCGRTERERAQEALDALRATYVTDDFWLAHRETDDDSWSAVEE